MVKLRVDLLYAGCEDNNKLRKNFKNTHTHTQQLMVAPVHTSLVQTVVSGFHTESS